jgi:hypothetical protein
MASRRPDRAASRVKVFTLLNMGSHRGVVVHADACEGTECSPGGPDP